MHQNIAWIIFVGFIFVLCQFFGKKHWLMNVIIFILSAWAVNELWHTKELSYLWKNEILGAGSIYLFSFVWGINPILDFAYYVGNKTLEKKKKRSKRK